jgi:hypothetical protein
MWWWWWWWLLLLVGGEVPIGVLLEIKIVIVVLRRCR